MFTLQRRKLIRAAHGMMTDIKQTLSSNRKVTIYAFTARDSSITYGGVYFQRLRVDLLLRNIIEIKEELWVMVVAAF